MSRTYIYILDTVVDYKHDSYTAHSPRQILSFVKLIRNQLLTSGKLVNTIYAF